MSDALEKLLAVMAQLRSPDKGCVWDKQQTYQSIVPYTIEETYELVEAIENNDFEALPDELGDLLFQIVFYAQIAKEEGRFDFYDVCKRITGKMIRRHPHVFADVKIESVTEQSRLWRKLKQEEKKETQQGRLDGVSLSAPGMAVANKLQKRAADAGFDWPDIQGPVEKLEEELAEVKHAICHGTQEQIKDEIGDLIFCAINIARHMQVDPEAALRHANRKFVRRFKGMEALSEADNQKFENLSLDEMEEYWAQVKKK